MISSTETTIEVEIDNANYVGTLNVKLGRGDRHAARDNGGRCSSIIHYGDDSAITRM